MMTSEFKLFISHSCKTESSRALRKTIITQLAGEKGIEILCDEKLRPGQPWRAKLDRWLAECDGGVILFTQDALESPWVLKEAQILTWRKAVAKRIVLLPVLLEPVKSRSTAMENWRPVQIREIQFIRGQDPEQMNDATRNSLAGEIVREVRQQIGRFGTATMPDPIQDWIDNLADDLRQAGSDRLKKAAGRLGIDVAEEAPPDDDPVKLAYMVATRLLHFGCEPFVGGVAKESFDEAADILKKTIRTFNPKEKERIAKLFFPVWVNPDAARHIMPISAGEVPRLVAINGTEPNTGDFYANRATCTRAYNKRSVVISTDIHDGDPDMVWREYDRLIKHRFHLERVASGNWNSALKDLVKDRGGVFVVLYGEACKQNIIDELTERYPVFTFILMVGDRFTDLTNGGLNHCTMLSPELQCEDYTICNIYDDIIST